MDEKVILVTGGAGFIGANFVYRALKKRSGWLIVNLDSLTYAGNLMNLDELSKTDGRRHEFVHGDIRDKKLLKSVFEKYKPQAVVHFAAESHVDRSILGPEAFLESNVAGTFNLLEASLNHWKNIDKSQFFKFLNISTDEVYGSLGLDGHFTESTPYDPSSPYSASKAASDHFVTAYFRTFGLPAIITHCSNNYGPFQFPEKLIPLMIVNIIEEKTLPLYGKGKNVRDWIYVKDHCDALIKILEDGRPGETYNIGGDQEVENIDIVKLICLLMDEKLDRANRRPSTDLIEFVSDRPGHDFRYAIDNSKIRQTIGWAPAFKLRDGLNHTIDWYLSHRDWLNMVKSGKYREWIYKNYADRKLYQQ